MPTPDACQEPGPLFEPGEAGPVELLARVLSHGRAPRPRHHAQAARLLAEGGLGSLARRSRHELVGAGLPASAAWRLHAAFALGQRASEEAAADLRHGIEGQEAALAWARARLIALPHEEVWVLLLDGRLRLLGAHRVAQGGQHGCALYPRDVLRVALREGASRVVLVHNHPSGDPTPSPEDVHLTRALAVAARTLGIPLIDHLVVARGGSSSLLALGHLG